MFARHHQLPLSINIQACHTSTYSDAMATYWSSNWCPSCEAVIASCAGYLTCAWFEILSNKCILSRISVLKEFVHSTETETALISSVTRFSGVPDLNVNTIFNLTWESMKYMKCNSFDQNVVRSNLGSMVVSVFGKYLLHLIL